MYDRLMTQKFGTNSESCVNQDITEKYEFGSSTDGSVRFSAVNILV